MLTGRDPTINIFQVGPKELLDTNFISISAPAGSTAIINVTGSYVGVANAGIQLNGVSMPRLLWNLYQASRFETGSISVPGSVLAPFAEATIGWGDIKGTLIVDKCFSLSQLHQVPFGNNWLVP